MGKKTKHTHSDCRTANDADSIRQSFLDNLHLVQAKFPEVATSNDLYLALALTVRDRLMRKWVDAASTFYREASRTLAYLSAEYLPGPQLCNALLTLGIEAPVREALSNLGLNLDDLAAAEIEPGLGNGGLGRLASCYLDSLATLQIPAIAYGIRYEFGIFEQAVRDGRQVELADKWLRYGNPWEIPRPEIAFEIGFGGTVGHVVDTNGRLHVRWQPAQRVKGVAYDTPVPGFRVPTVNLLRLWSAEACEAFDLAAFNSGDYERAVEEKIASETISKILYPNDEPAQGKRLRLQQQYFFAACTVQDALRLALQQFPTVDRLPEKFVIQLNDTHPAIVIAELMRLLVDVHDMDWEPAWATVRNTVSYTNHTLLPEALETWPVDLFREELPRHLEIIFEINRRFLEEVRMRRPADENLVTRLSIIDEEHGRRVRMAHLACVGSRWINGVAELHSRLLRERVLADFHSLEPERFTSVTNGVTPRRFILLANPHLASVITDAIGDGWITDLERLSELEQHIDNSAFCDTWRSAKQHNKKVLAAIIREITGTAVDPVSLFDCHIKRIHEYKRQHLNVLHIVSEYLRLKEGDYPSGPPRTWVFAGKAAPGYRMAKLIIELILGVSRTVNSDKDTRDSMRVVFVPNLNVHRAERIYAAADLSEQISTAGMEASGTGNMKFALNGAITIGTLDGANIEIRERVGEENFFLFGHTEDEIATRSSIGYQPRQLYDANPRLHAAIDAIAAGRFSEGDRGRFAPLVENLVEQDPYFVLADFDGYAASQRQVAETWSDCDEWVRHSILNTARCGWFSSDRAVAEYCNRIWNLKPVRVESQAARNQDARVY